MCVCVKIFFYSFPFCFEFIKICLRVLHNIYIFFLRKSRYCASYGWMFNALTHFFPSNKHKYRHSPHEKPNTRFKSKSWWEMQVAPCAKRAIFYCYFRFESNFDHHSLTHRFFTRSDRSKNVLSPRHCSRESKNQILKRGSVAICYFNQNIPIFLSIIKTF